MNALILLADGIARSLTKPMHARRPQPAVQRPSRGRLLRALLWLCTIVFALQMLGSTWHRHELAGTKADCVGCHLSAHVPATTPGAAPLLLAVFLTVAYLLVRLPHSAPRVRPSCTTPSQQAPPRLA